MYQMNVSVIMFFDIELILFIVIFFKEIIFIVFDIEVIGLLRFLDIIQFFVNDGKDFFNVYIDLCQLIS